MSALENLLTQTLPVELSGATVNGKVTLLSSSSFPTSRPQSSTLGLYPYRVIVDATGRNRWLPPLPGTSGVPRRELPLNIHFLLISWGGSAQIELDLHAWAMTQLAATPELDVAALSGVDAGWREGDRAQVLPEELPTEDLFKIWDGFPSKYSLTAAYVLKTARVELPTDPAGAPVISRGFAMEVQP